MVIDFSEEYFYHLYSESVGYSKASRMEYQEASKYA